MQKVICCAIRTRSDGEWRSSSHHAMLEIGTAIANSITSVCKDSMIIIVTRRRK